MSNFPGKSWGSLPNYSQPNEGRAVETLNKEERICGSKGQKETCEEDSSERGAVARLAEFSDSEGAREEPVAVEQV